MMGAHEQIIVTTPGQCRAMRKPWWRWWFIEEDRCEHYSDHKDHAHNNPSQAQHENALGLKWD